MPFMTRIPSDLARFGLRVELVPDWETRGSSSFAPACVVDHWTAGPRGTTGRPSLNVCVHGRTGLPGPLCNIYLARDGACVVVAAGRANHAGAGGFRGLVGNSAAYGIEAECGGDGDWTPAMLDAYPRLNAALLSGLGRDASWVCGHNEWAPTRKIDIRDIIAAVRSQTAAILAGGANPPSPRIPQGDNDMAVIKSPNRRPALVGPGYFRELSDEEAANTGPFGAVISGNDRQYDLWVAMATTGQTVLDMPIPRNEKAGGGVTTLRAQAHWEDYNARTVVPEAVAKLVGTPQIDAEAFASQVAEALAGKVGLSREDVKSAMGEVLIQGAGTTV